MLAPAPFAGIHFKKSVPGLCPVVSHLICGTTHPKFAPISRIDEGAQDHFTQILFILKEALSRESGYFPGWRPFTKDYLIELCKLEEHVYKDNWQDGDAFVDEFPQKIIEFLILYCNYESANDC